MTKTALFRLWLLSGCSLASAWAQIGDAPNEVQKPIVPASQIPSAPALTPEQALKSFTVAPGFKLEIAAAEPLVQEPVAATFGPDGRLWVVEMRGYMPDLDGNGEDAPVGRVVILTDRDGDGRFDDSKVFVDQLVLPRAIQLIGDGALIGAPPELALWRDTDGDGKADQKTVVASDYGVMTDPKRPQLANPERAPNSLLWAFDNWIYSSAYTKKFRLVKGQWETGVTTFRGQWGLSQDDYGRFYHGSNSDHLRVDVVWADALHRNPHYPRLSGGNVNAATDQLVWPARVNPGINRGYKADMLRDYKLKAFTAAGGQWIYRGDLMPGMYGNHFVAEPSANLVHRSVLTAENGAVRGRTPYEKAEFVASTDERFRPVAFTTGPDGALYIIDLYRGVLQHRISLTTYLRKQSEDRGLASPLHLGRIYRVVPTDKPTPRVPSIAPMTSAQWAGRLAHPNAWWRETAQRILIERGDAAVVPAIRQVALSSSSPVGRVHALWTLAGLEALEQPTLMSALADKDPLVRLMAIRASERFLTGPGKKALSERILALAKSDRPEIQVQAVLTLGAGKDIAIDRVLAQAVRMHPRNVYLADALYSGLNKRELALLEQLVADPAWGQADADANKLLSGLARGVFASRELPAVERLFTLIAAQLPAGSQRAGALLDGVIVAAAATQRPLQFARMPDGWSKMEGVASLKTRLAKLESIIVWPNKPGLAATAAAAPLSAEQQARFTSGKTLFTAVCATCHQVDGRGLDGLAPPLLDSEWVLGSTERLVRIVLQGVRGQITVLGKVHMGDMPAFGAFDDEQVSSVLTYLRREWGHAATAVDPAHVKKIRTDTASRADAWTAVELNRIK